MPPNKDDAASNEDAAASNEDAAASNEDDSTVAPPPGPWTRIGFFALLAITLALGAWSLTTLLG